MDDKRKIERSVCSRQVSFCIGEKSYRGTIENISKEGTLILTKVPEELRPQKEIDITITSADQWDRKKARIIWVDEGAFGAEFI